MSKKDAKMSVFGLIPQMLVETQMLVCAQENWWRHISDTSLKEKRLVMVNMQQWVSKIKLLLSLLEESKQLKRFCLQSGSGYLFFPHINPCFLK